MALRLLIALSVLLLPLTSCVDTNGEIDSGSCSNKLPDTLDLNPDSLVLVPYASCIETRSDTSAKYWCWDGYAFQRSASDTSAALPSFAPNNLILTQDGIPTYVPPPYYSGGTGWQCPKLMVMDRIILDRRVARDTVTMGVRRGVDSTRFWAVEYDYDTAKAPDFAFEKTGDGFSVTVTPKAGTRLATLTFGIDGWIEDLRNSDYTIPVTAAVSFKKIALMNRDAWASELDRQIYEVCAAADSTIQTLRAGGRSFPAISHTCRILPHDLHAAADAYARRKCLDCK